MDAIDIEVKHENEPIKLEVKEYSNIRDKIVYYFKFKFHFENEETKEYEIRVIKDETGDFYISINGNLAVGVEKENIENYLSHYEPEYKFEIVLV